MGQAMTIFGFTQSNFGRFGTFLPVLTVCWAGCVGDRPGPEERNGDPGYGMGRSQDSVPLFEAPSDPASVPTWTVDPTPEIVLRGDEDDQGRFFHRVAVGRLFDDGSFVVADGGSKELRFFSTNGVLERTIGRAGTGPGDFGSFDLMSVVRDSLFVFDRWNSRIAVLGPQGEISRYLQVPPRSRVKGVFDTGSVLFGSVVPAPDKAGYRAIQEDYFIQDPDGSIQPVGRFLMTESHWIPLGTGEIIDVGLPFGRVGSVVSNGSEWFFSDGSNYSVVQLGTDGGVVARFSNPTPPRRVTDRDLDAWIALRKPDGEPWSLEREVRRIPLHENIPAYDRLLLDRSGNLWAKPYAPPGVQTCWHVFHRRPFQYARACLPEGLRPLDVGSYRVLGVIRDEFDVEFVALYGLKK